MSSSEKNNNSNSQHRKSTPHSDDRNPKDINDSIADQKFAQNTEYIPSDGKVLYIQNQSLSQPPFRSSTAESLLSIIDVNELNKTKMKESLLENSFELPTEISELKNNEEERPQETFNLQPQDAQNDRQNDDESDILLNDGNHMVSNVNSTSTMQEKTIPKLTDVEAPTTKSIKDTDNNNFLRICAISDTHQLHHAVTESIPVCDILIHTGDIFYLGRRRTHEKSLEILLEFNNWLESLPAKHIIVIAGNHDCILEGMDSKEINEKIFPSERIHYLCCEYVDLEGYRFIGIPTSQGESKNKAFQNESFVALADQFVQEIGTMGNDDGDNAQSQHSNSSSNNNLRRILLTHSVQDPKILEFLGPEIHFWGHCHFAYGAEYTNTRKSDNPKGHKYWSICSSVVDLEYKTRNRPIVIDIPL